MKRVLRRTRTRSLAAGPYPADGRVAKVDRLVGRPSIGRGRSDGHVVGKIIHEGCGVMERFRLAGVALSMALAVLLPQAGRGSERDIIGAWELTYVAPADINDTDPRGITNTKLEFTADGHLRAMAPDAQSADGADSAAYEFDGKRLTVRPASGRAQELAISFPDDVTMISRQRYGSERTYKRIASVDVRIEPKSLQLVRQTVDPGLSVSYDETDHSKDPVSRRIRGVWEVTALRNVARNDVPPFGFLYASVNPRIPAASLIRQSSPQAKNLEVTDERDTIIAIEAARRYSGLVGGAHEGAAGFRAKPGGLLPCAGFGSKVLYAVEAQTTWARGFCRDG